MHQREAAVSQAEFAEHTQTRQEQQRVKNKHLEQIE
jgi:hypothetical protein